MADADALLLGLGLSWFVAAWGVFIKDMTQIVPMFVQMLMFMSPVFYPISAVPAVLQPVHHYNPLSAVIEASRAAVTGQPIAWGALGIHPRLVPDWRNAGLCLLSAQPRGVC